MNHFALRIWVFLLVCLAPATAFAADELKEADVFGDWVFPENGSVIRFYRCGEGICGKIMKVEDPSRRDIHNPDPALRNRPVVGIVLFSSQYKKGPTTWRGKLYNTLDGSMYEGTLNMLNKNKFTVVGCILGNLLCDAKTFIRLENPKANAKAETAQRSGGTTPPPPGRGASKPVRQAAAARSDPTRADFDAFLASRGTSVAAIQTVEQKEVLFSEFLAWWEKRGDRRRTAPN